VVAAPEKGDELDSATAIICVMRGRRNPREKHRYVLLVYRRVHGKEQAWQLLPEHGEALDGFEEHLEVSVRVFPVSACRELT
jgi:hypothetical protein